MPDSTDSECNRVPDSAELLAAAFLLRCLLGRHKFSTQWLTGPTQHDIRLEPSYSCPTSLLRRPRDFKGQPRCWLRRRVSHEVSRPSNDALLNFCSTKRLYRAGNKFGQGLHRRKRRSPMQGRACAGVRHNQAGCALALGRAPKAALP